MAGLAWKDEIRDAAAIVRKMYKSFYGYYMRLRPPSPGAQPEKAIGYVSFAYRTWHDGICDDIWGWVCYENPLSEDDVKQYDLLPDEDNPCRYQEYGLMRYVKTIDDSGRCVRRRERVLEDGKPFRTSYPRVAFAKMDAMNKELGADTVKVAKVTPKETTDGAPT